MLHIDSTLKVIDEFVPDEDNVDPYADWERLALGVGDAPREDRGDGIRWRIRMRHDYDDGSWTEADITRPQSWLEEIGARVGGTVRLAMEEFGAVGEFDVLSIAPSTIRRPLAHGLVTGVFRHSHAHVLDVTLAGGETLGITPGHPVWCVERGGWTPVGELRPGEHLWTKHGPTRIESIERSPEPVEVVTLEVEGDHVYRTNSTLVLVHNSSWDPLVGIGPAEGTEVVDGYRDQAGVKATKNIAYIEVKFDDDPEWTDFGVSGPDEEPPPPENPRLPSFPVRGTPRETDSEKKLLEQLLADVDARLREGACKIRVRLYSEFEICDSCQEAIQSICLEYEGRDVRIIATDGEGKDYGCAAPPEDPE